MDGSKYRLYVDEIGNHDLDKRRKTPAERYLALTGVILDLDYVRTTVSPPLEDLKARHFGSHPDDPIVLHRRELIDKKKSFAVLRDPAKCAAFDADLMAWVRGLDYSVITVVIDKWEAYRRYGEATRHPYHYCMVIMVERFVLEMRARKAVGDVMAETRGGAEDRTLKAEYTAAYERGSPTLRKERFQAHLTTKDLKIRPKSANIAGLQLADVLAYPAWRFVRQRHDKWPLPGGMTAEIAELLGSSKFCRDDNGVIRGYGTKWLP